MERDHAAISIHALLAESDPRRLATVDKAQVFLSTLSLRRATLPGCPTNSSSYISIHALLAESDSEVCAALGITYDISIHALLAESDTNRRELLLRYQVFLSTLSLRRATPAVPLVSGITRISIHALLAESDVVHLAQAASPGGISIHALLAESDASCVLCRYVTIIISIHALLAESDAVAVVGATQPGDISIHALLAESDTMWTAAIWYTSISIHALLAESDP